MKEIPGLFDSGVPNQIKTRLCLKAETPEHELTKEFKSNLTIVLIKTQGASPSNRDQCVSASLATARSTPGAINPTARAWPLLLRSRGRGLQDSPLGWQMSTNH
jgi:hypothetical protein